MRDNPRFLRLSVLAMAAVMTAATTVGPAAYGQQLDQVTVDLTMPEPENPEQFAEMLQRTEENAIDIREGASRLLAFIASPGEYTWLTHAWRLQRLEERTSDLRAAVARLEARTQTLLDGQRAALTQIQPAAEELRPLVTEALNYVEMVRSGDFDPRYTELVKTIRDKGNTIVNAVRLAEALSVVRDHLEALH